MNRSVTEATSHVPESAATQPLSLRELAQDPATRRAMVKRVLDRTADEGYVAVAAFHSAI
jgi:hypothetical protein